MADNSFGELRIQNAPDLAGAFLAVRGEQRISPEPEEPITDISVILQGNQAVTGKAVWSSNSPARLVDANTAEHRHEVAEEERRELARLARWDAAMTSVGGVEMTNAEAQGARREVVNDGDRYAKWAVDHGYIAKGEEDQFKDAARRMYELKEAERTNGKMTEAQQREWDSLEASQKGQAVDRVAGDIHADRTMLTAPVANPTTSGPRDSPFPNAPAIHTDFKAAVTPSATQQIEIERQPAPISPKPQASIPGY